jgi:hypothetical protein
VQRGSISHSIHENVSGGVGAGSNLDRIATMQYEIMSLSRPPLEERVRTSYRGGMFRIHLPLAYCTNLTTTFQFASHSGISRYVDSIIYHDIIYIYISSKNTHEI